MCGYDLLGFQTEIDRAAFIDYAVRHAGRLVARGGGCRFTAAWCGPGFIRSACTSMRCARRRRCRVNRRQATRMRADLLDRLILSVDRLDYSKGLPQRFAAFERFLAEYPAHHGLVTFMQIAPPSRSDIETYQRDPAATGGRGRAHQRHVSPRWTGCRCAI